MSRRFKSLDLFRGFAALWVLVFHACAVWIEDGTLHLPPLLEWVAMNGWRGVQIFFAISGYCITERLARDWNRVGAPHRFLLDRSCRILPPYWAALAFSVALNVASVPLNHTAMLATNTNAGAIPTSLTTWFGMLTLSEIGWGNRPYLLVSWTLAYELVFYATAAGAFWLSNRARRAEIGFAVGAMLAAIGLFTRVGTHLPVMRAWSDFFLGSLAWLLINRSQLKLPGIAALGVATGLVIISLAPLLSTESTTTIASGTALMMLLLHRVDRRVAGSRVGRYLGAVGTFSFSLYLVHVPVVGKIRNFVGRFDPSPSTAAVVVLLACAAGVLAAWMFYRLIERPAEALRKARFSPMHSQLKLAQA